MRSQSCKEHLHWLLRSRGTACLSCSSGASSLLLCSNGPPCHHLPENDGGRVLFLWLRGDSSCLTVRMHASILSHTAGSSSSHLLAVGLLARPLATRSGRASPSQVSSAANTSDGQCSQGHMTGRRGRPSDPAALADLHNLCSALLAERMSPWAPQLSAASSHAQQVAPHLTQLHAATCSCSPTPCLATV